MGPLPINLSKVIFETFCFPADNISSCVAWKFRGGINNNDNTYIALIRMRSKRFTSIVLQYDLEI